jgi:TPR repeat protein
MNISELKSLAEIGDTLSAFALGVLAEHHFQDPVQAEKYYRISAQTNDLAKMALASMLLFGNNKIDPSSDEYAEGMAIAKWGADRGIALGHLIMGVMMLATSTNVSEAIEHLSTADSLGNRSASLHLATIFADAGGESYDLLRAERLMQNANNWDRDGAATVVATIHFLRGRDVDGLAALSHGVDSGDPSALNSMAIIYRLGAHGVEKNIAMAEKLETRARSAKRRPVV